MKIVDFKIMHCNAGWRDFSFLKIMTDEGVSGISEYNECYGSPGLSIIISRCQYVENNINFYLLHHRMLCNTNYYFSYWSEVFISFRLVS